MAPSEEETALIRKVVDDPEHDAPRLAYADWLEQQGRAPRARLIRVQCQLEQLQAEEKKLIADHGQEWGLDLFRYGADDWNFHRGFPEEISIRFSDYFQKREQFDTITPLSRIRLIGGTDDQLKQLANLPAARQLRSLEIDLEDSYPDPDTYGIDGVRALARSPYLSELRQLRLHSHKIGAEGARAIAGSANFKNLTHLVLTDPSLSKVDGLRSEMERSPHLSEVEKLVLAERSHNPKYFREKYGFRLPDFRDQEPNQRRMSASSLHRKSRNPCLA